MSVKPRRGTTTVTLKDGPLRCKGCGQKAAVLSLDVNGKAVCSDCLGTRAVPARVVEGEERRASETAAD